MSWEKVKLGDIADTSSGGTPNREVKDYWVNGNIPWIKSGQLKDCVIDNAEEFITETALKKSSAKVFNKGTLLLALYGATAGKLGFLGLDAATNQAVCSIVPKNNKLNNRYLYYFLLSKRNKIISDSTGGAQPNISQHYVKNIEIPLPPLHIQQHIANVLDKADALRQKDQLLLHKYDELAQSIFYDMFGDPVKNEKGWEVKKIPDVTFNLNNFRRPVKSNDREKMHGNYPYYGATGIIDYVNSFTHDGEFVLISEDGKNLVGRYKKVAFLASGKIWVNNHSHVLKANEFLDNFYLEYYLNKVDFKPFVTGIDQFKLNKNNLDLIQILVPPIQMQKIFRKKISSVDEQLILLKRKEENTANLFNNLLNKFFS